MLGSFVLELILKIGVVCLLMGRSRMSGKMRVGAWCVDPVSGEIVRKGETARLEARAMRLLVCLAERPGEVVSIDALLDRVWPDVTVAPDSVYQAVASLRRLLGDDARQASYISTIPRLGYRLVAEVGPWVERDEPRSGDVIGGNVASGSEDLSSEDVSTAPSGPLISRFAGSTASQRKKPIWGVRRMPLWLGGAVLGIAAGVAMLMHGIGGDAPAALPAHAELVQRVQRSLAVLPFLDLTEGMKEEEFADGMTEELIDQLSKIQGLRVPSPTSSFYFKGKQIPVAEMAKTLGVAYVLDGSVRKAGGRVRVAARLVRAEDGFVLWTESYDRPFDDILMVQEDIAGAVTKALRASQQLPSH
jgi:transcriptional activator of cad operon